MKIKLATYIDSNNVDEHLLYELFSIEMQKLNDEQQTLVDDIVFKKEIHHKILYTFFSLEVHE